MFNGLGKIVENNRSINFVAQWKECPAGYYCPGDNTKRDCGCGNYCPAGSSKPTPCGPKKYSISNNASSCQTAQIGYYASGTCNQIACTNKPANSSYTSNSSSNSCSWSCNTNYHQEGSSCVYNWRDVACNRSGAPSNASYNSYNVTVSWNGSSWNGAANCSWYCNTNYHPSGSSCVENEPTPTCSQGTRSQRRYCTFTPSEGRPSCYEAGYDQAVTNNDPSTSCCKGNKGSVYFLNNSIPYAYGTYDCV